MRALFLVLIKREGRGILDRADSEESWPHGGENHFIMRTGFQLHLWEYIARELVDTVKKNTSIDWTVRENVQAKMRIAVKKILRKHGYPPDMELKATETVIEQAKLLANDMNIKPYDTGYGNYSIAAEPSWQ